MARSRTPTLGDRIRERRVKLDLTPEQVAARVGVRMMTIWRIEVGETTDPSWSTVVRIARVLHLDLEELAEDVPDIAA